MEDVRGFVEKKAVAFLTCVLFGAQCLLAYQPETSFWSERRRATQKQPAILMAGSPTDPTVGSQSLAAQFPVAESINNSISSSVSQHIPEQILKSNVAVFSALSPTYGRVRKFSLAPGTRESSPIVIHVQDVHRNTEAQWNIRETVSALLGTGQVSFLALEGATEQIALQPYLDFPHPDAVRLAADYLLRENDISGPIHAALTAQQTLPPILGIDDPTLYTANVQAYRNSAPRLDQSRGQIKKLQAELDERKKNVYSPALLTFDKSVADYRNGRIGLGPYVQSLMTATKAEAPAAKTFLQALALERALDFHQVEIERVRLVTALTQRLHPKETNALLADSLAYRAGRLGYADFYARLKNICRQADLKLSAYPAMDAYIRYVLLADGIDAERLLNELNDLEKAAFTQLSRRAEERILVNQSRQAWLSQQLVNFSLTPLGWAEYETIPTADRNPQWASFESFYRAAHKRDEAMAHRLIAELQRSTHRPVAVLVTGGYHADGIAQRLNRQGITVVSFVPKIEKIDSQDGSTYLSVFTQEKTPLEKLFQGEKLFLAQSPWKTSVRQALAPALVVLAVGLVASVSGFDFSTAYASLGGKGVLSSVTIGDGTVVAALATVGGSISVKVVGSLKALRTVVWSTVAEKRERWMARALSTRERRVGARLAQKAEVVLLGGGSGMERMGQAQKAIHTVQGPVKALVSNLSQSGRSAALQTIVFRDWSRWISHFREFLEGLPRWITCHFDLVPVRTVPSMGYPMQALEGGIARAWLKALLSEEITDYRGLPSDWLDRLVLKVREREDYIQDSEQSEKIIQSIRGRLMALPESLQGLIRADTVRLDGVMIPRAQPLRNLVFLGALYRDHVVRAPGLLSRSALHHMVSGLAEDLDSSVVPLGVGLETAWDVSMVGLDDNDREVKGEQAISLRSEIGPLARVQLADRHRGDARGYRPMADPEALRAIREAKQIVLGPANLTTLVGALAPAGILEAMAEAKARGATVTWFLSPVQNRDTEGLTPAGVVEVLENSLSTPGRPVSLGSIFTDVVVNDPTPSSNASQALLRKKTDDLSQTTDPEKKRHEAELVSGFWEKQTPEEIQVELEDLLNARVFVVPMAELTEEGTFSYPLHRLVTFFSLLRIYAAHGRLVGVFDKDDTTNKANTEMELSMADTLVRALRAGFIFAASTASSFEELIKHFRPLFLILMNKTFTGLRLPLNILKNQLPMIASIMDARLYGPVVGGGYQYQQAMSSDLFNSVADMMEKEAREKRESMEDRREILRTQGIAFLTRVRGTWSGFETVILAAEKIHPVHPKGPLLDKSRERMIQMETLSPAPEWIGLLSDVMKVRSLSPRNALALFLEIHCAWAVVTQMTPEDIDRTVRADLDQLNGEFPPAYKDILVKAVIQGKKDPAVYAKLIETRKRGFEWPQTIREGLARPSLSTREVIALWLEALLARERARRDVYGARVERRMKAPEEDSASDVPQGLSGVLGNRRAQYVLRNILSKRAQVNAEARVRAAIHDAGIPLDAGRAGTSSVNFVPHGQSKRNALLLLARLFHLPVMGDDISLPKRILGLIFADDKPNIGEVAPAFAAADLSVNAGQSPLGYSTDNTVVHPPRAGPEGVKDFVNDVAVVLETMNHGVPVQMSQRPAAWAELMRKAVTGRYAVNLMRGRGVFKSGGERLSVRANALEELLAEKGVLKTLLGEAGKLKAEGVRYVIYAGVGGVGALGRMLDEWPSKQGSVRIFPLEHIDPSEIERLKAQLVTAEASAFEKLKMAAGSLATTEEVWERARFKSALVVVAKGLTEEGNDSIKSLTSLVSESFGQVDPQKPSNHIFIFADPPIQADDRSVPEITWQMEIGAQLIPLQGRELLKRDLHPGLPLAFLLALKNESPFEVFEEAVKLNRKGEAGDGFLRLAAWVEGYVREGKNQMVLILPSDMDGMGPLTTRSVEPSLLSNAGNSPQVAYGLPVNPQAFPSAKDAHTVFVHVRREGVGDENSDGVGELRRAGHPVAVITLPRDPYVAFTVWMEGMFRFSSALGAFEQKKAISTPDVPAYRKAVDHFKNGGTEVPFPVSSFEGIGLHDEGVFNSGRLQSDRVEALLHASGITHPNAADRYAACLYALSKQCASDGQEIAEIRYFGSASPSMAVVLKKGQTMLSFLVKKMVRLSQRIHADYMGSLARPIYGTPVLMETLLWPAPYELSSWKTNQPEVQRLLSGEDLRLRQRATLETFREAKTPHILLTLPAGDKTASLSLQRFFKHVEKRFKQFQKSESEAPPGQASSGQETSRSSPREERDSSSILGRILLAVGDFTERMLDSVGRRFGLPHLYPGVVPEGPTGAMPSLSGRGSDPMNFRHLPKNEILEVLRQDLGDHFPSGDEDRSISVEWPAWYDSDAKEKEYPVPEIKVHLRDGRRVSYFLKPSTFLVPTQIGLEMQRRLGVETCSVWSVPNWIVVGDAGLDTPTTLTLINRLWAEAERTNDEAAQDILRKYMGEMNGEIGKLLATEVILGYNDAHGKNVMVRGFRDLQFLMNGSPGENFQEAIQWLKQHPPRMQLFDFGAHQFLSVFLREHYWEPGGTDYMVLYAEEAFNGLLRFSRAIGSLEEPDVKKGFLDQMNRGLSQEDDLIDYLEEAIPPGRSSYYFVPGFDVTFRDRLMDDPNEWYKTLLADTVLFDYKPTFPPAGKKIKTELKALRERLATGAVRRTANVFDLDGDPRALERLIPLVKAGRIDEVIVHGDVFDRGSNNKGCLEAMQELKSLLGDRFIYLFGNHEIMMIESLILKKQRTLPIWLDNGGVEVLREFGAGVLRLAEETVRKLNELEPVADPELHANKGFRWRIFTRWVRHLLHNSAIYGSYRVADLEYEKFLNDPEMKPVLDLAWWVLKNGRFHYVDDKGWVHLHAGMPLGLDKKPQFTALELREEENRLAILLQYAQAPYQLDVRRREAVTAMFHKLSGVFWVRKSYWIYRFFNPSRAQRTQLPLKEDPKLRAQANTIARVTGMDPERQYQLFLKKFLKPEDRLFILHFDPHSWEWMNSILQHISPGSQGIMIGHNRVSTLHNVDNRFICADTGRPHIVLSGPEGIQFATEKDDLEKGDLPRTLFMIEKMIERVDKDLLDLKERKNPHLRKIDFDVEGIPSIQDREPLSLAYLLSGDWRWGMAGLLVEWGVGVTGAHALAGALSPTALGIFPATALAVGLMAVGLYMFSFTHALVIAKRVGRASGRGPPRPIAEMTHAFFRDFFPYLILPLVLILAPAWSDVASIFVLAGHVTRDLRSQMGRDILGRFRGNGFGPGTSESVTDPAAGILGLMPEVGPKIFDVEDILGAIENPSVHLDEKAKQIFQKASPEQREKLSSLEGAENELLNVLAVDRDAVALVPLTSDVLAHPNLIQMARHTLDLHQKSGAVFYVESNADVTQKEKFKAALASLKGPARFVQLEADVHLFEGQELMMATLARFGSTYGPRVQPYCPPGYSVNDSGLMDKDKLSFGKNAVLPMGLLLYFERFMELARLIAQQA